MPRTKRTELPPVTVGIARTRRSEVRRTPNGGWAWKCCLCDSYASVTDQDDHKLCQTHGHLAAGTLRIMLTAWHYSRTGNMPVPPLTWGRTIFNDPARFPWHHSE